MKKLFSLLFVAMLTMSAWATDVTFTFSELGYANSDDVTTVTDDDGYVTLTFDGGTNTQNTPKYYTSGTAVRLYAGNTMTVESEKNITGIAFTYASGTYNWTDACVTVGAYADGVWAGNANSVLFSNVTGRQVRIQQIVVTVAEGVVETVDAPTFNPTSQDFLTEYLDVELACATEGATIYYNFDGGDNWTAYNGAIRVTATTTIYAKAVKNNIESLVVNATYTKIDPVQEVTYVLVTDAADLAEGDKIIFASSGVAGDAYAMGASRGNNFGAVDVTVENNLTISTHTANVMTLEGEAGAWNFKTADGYLYAASSSANQMKLENEVDADGNATATITIADDVTVIAFQGTNTRNYLRYNYNSGNPLFSCYAENSSVQTPVYIYKSTSDVPVVEVAAPVFDPAGRVFTGSQIVTLTCATEGAAIYYSINDGEYALYEGPITLTATSNIKAYAELNNVQSAVASANYTKRVEVNNIADANALNNKVDFVFYGDAVVTYQNGKNLWIRDNSGSGLIYGDQVPELAQGVVLEQGWEAQKYNFRGGLVPEFQYPYEVQASGNTVTVEPFERETLTNANVNEYVIMKGLSIIAETDTAVDNYQKYYYNAADSMVLYNQFGVQFTLEEGKTYDVVGTVTVYNEKPQLYIISVTEHVDVPAGMRGDVDCNEAVEIADVTALINALLTGDWNDRSETNADTNLDGEAGIADVTTLISYLLTGNWPVVE